MAQQVHYWVDGKKYQRELPDASGFVISDVCWGDHWRLFTPAYWLSQVWMCGLDVQRNSPYRTQGTLEEELVFCLLSGFGIKAELATTAFQVCRKAGLISELNTRFADWADVLKTPMEFEGRMVRYRYPNQKAKYLANAMHYLQNVGVNTNSGREMRDSLLMINGIGPKTAGFITRNFLDSDDIAILDIHIIRAGLLCNLFKINQKVGSQYLEMEEQYINFCHSLKVRPAVLDCIIWDQMRTLGSFALDALKLKTDKTILASHKIKKPWRENMQTELLFNGLFPVSA